MGLKTLRLKKRTKEMMLRLKKRTKVLGDPWIWWKRRRKPSGVKEENALDDAEVEHKEAFMFSIACVALSLDVRIILAHIN